MAPMTPEQESDLFKSLGEIRGELKGINGSVNRLETSMQGVRDAVAVASTNIEDLQRRTGVLEESLSTLQMPEVIAPRRRSGVWKERGAVASIGVGLGAFLVEVITRIFAAAANKHP